MANPFLPLQHKKGETMNQNGVINTLRNVIDQHLATITTMKKKIHNLELIIKGMSEPFESNYMALKPHLTQAQERVIEFFKTRKGYWIPKDDVERLILNRYPYYKRGTIPRQCRQLENDGLLIVRYEKKVPCYTLNLKYGE